MANPLHPTPAEECRELSAQYMHTVTDVYYASRKHNKYERYYGDLEGSARKSCNSWLLYAR